MPTDAGVPQHADLEAHHDPERSQISSRLLAGPLCILLVGDAVSGVED